MTRLYFNRASLMAASEFVLNRNDIVIFSDGVRSHKEAWAQFPPLSVTWLQRGSVQTEDRDTLPPVTWMILDVFLWNHQNRVKFGTGWLISWWLFLKWLLNKHNQWLALIMHHGNTKSPTGYRLHLSLRSNIKVELKASKLFVGLVTLRVLLTANSSEAFLLLSFSIYITDMLPPSMHYCVFRY